MKNILIAVTGETPQILTESIYFYLNKNQKFNRIIVLTTGKGVQKIKETIFKGEILEQLFKDINKPPSDAPFTEEDIIVFKKDGNPIMDVRTDDDINAATKDFYALLQEYTSRDNTKIIANIAGGRKNMGASLALGMQLFGRQQDEMIHVLVDERVENKGAWFYPQNETEKDYIDVSSIPFIRVRDYIKISFVDKMDPEDMLELAQSNLEYNAPIKKVVVNRNAFEIDDKINFSLSAANAMMLRFLLVRILEKESDSSNQSHCHFLTKEEMVDLYNEFRLLEYKKFGEQHGNIADPKKNPFTIEDIRVRISKLKKQLEEKIIHPKYQKLFSIIQIEGKRLGLEIDSNAIQIIE